MLAVVILGPIILCQFAIGVLVYIEYMRTRRKELFTFLFLTISTLLWTISNVGLLSIDTATDQNIRYYALDNKIAFIFAILSLALIYYFSLVFPVKKQLNKFSKFILASCALFMCLAPFPILSGNFSIVGEKAVYTPGILSGLIGVLAVVAIVGGYAGDIKLLRSTHDPKLRKQITAILAGLIMTTIHAIIFIIILPLLLGQNTLLYAIGYTAPVYFVIFTLFALLRLGLFEIRMFVVRSAGYVLSLLTIGAISLLGLSLLTGLLADYNVPARLQRTIFVALSLFLAISYQPFKQAFDRLTRRLFYRDAYDTQVLLNEFNQVIVSTIDLSQLLNRAGVTIKRYLRPETVTFAIRAGEENKLRLISEENRGPSPIMMERIRSFVHTNPSKLLITSMLEEDEGELRQLLQEANIGMLARITTNPEVEGNGYIVMGYKKSGNMYNTQDTGAMEIVANELAIAMQNALQFEEIQKFNVTLQDKVDDATRKLKRTNDKLKQMDETKDEFISMASHQLRTPLTSVKGYLSMVLEGDAGEINEMQQKLLDQAFISSQRMVYLIADLLNVSRLRTGKFVIEAVSSNLADVVEGEVHQLIDTAKARGLTLTYQKPDNFPPVMIDETKIRQVIMNFMDNAIYYSKDDGHITVELKDKGDTIEYTVTDDGIGVPKAEQHHLFTKFYRAANAKKARPDGTGLGLFMAKKVVVAQGGSIIFKSDPGKGSTFGFSFQKSKLQALADAQSTI